MPITLSPTLQKFATALEAFVRQSTGKVLEDTAVEATVAALVPDMVSVFAKMVPGLGTLAELATPELEAATKAGMADLGASLIAGTTPATGIVEKLEQDVEQEAEKVLDVTGAGLVGKV